MGKGRLSIVGSSNTEFDDNEEDVVEHGELLDYLKVKSNEHISLAKIAFKGFGNLLTTIVEVEHMRQQRKLLEAEINHKRTTKKGQDSVDALKNKIKKGNIGFGKNKTNA